MIIVKGFIRSNVLVTKGYGGVNVSPFKLRPSLASIADIKSTLVSGRIPSIPGTIGGPNGERPTPVRGPTPTRPLSMLLDWLFGALRGFSYDN